jgi:hypothetical protein
MKTQHLGSFSFADDWSNYYYSQILIRDDKTIPASLTRKTVLVVSMNIKRRTGMGSFCIQDQ